MRTSCHTQGGFVPTKLVDHVQRVGAQAGSWRRRSLGGASCRHFAPHGTFLGTGQTFPPALGQGPLGEKAGAVALFAPRAVGIVAPCAGGSGTVEDGILALLILSLLTKLGIGVGIGVGIGGLRDEQGIGVGFGGREVIVVLLGFGVGERAWLVAVMTPEGPFAPRPLAVFVTSVGVSGRRKKCPSKLGFLF